MKCSNFRHLKDENGQAMIEFVLGLMIVISFFFFYVRMCAVFAVSNYIHYATFMASRAYMSAGQSQGDQTDRATNVLSAMVANRFKTIVKAKGGSGTPVGATIGNGPYFDTDPKYDYWNQGVTYSFSSKLSLYPWSKEGQSIMLDLTSESWMPRESADDENAKKMGAIKSALAAAGVANVDVEWDNGN